MRAKVKNKREATCAARRREASVSLARSQSQLATSSHDDDDVCVQCAVCSVVGLFVAWRARVPLFLSSVFVFVSLQSVFPSVVSRVSHKTLTFLLSHVVTR